MRSEDNTYFTFDTVFGQYADQSNNQYSLSGSLFEVQGIAKHPMLDPIKNKEAWVGWVLGAIGTVVVGAMLFVPGLNGLVVGALASSSTFWVWGLGYYLGTSALVAGIGITSMSLAALGVGITAAVIGHMTSQSMFTQIEDELMGYLASTYGHTVKWDGNTLDPTFDSILMVTIDCELGYTGNEANKNYITIPYYACSSARYVPNDMELTVEYPISNFGAETLSAYKANNNQKDKITVPKYQKENNDLYCCLTNFNENKILYPNYDDVKGMEVTDKNGNNYEDRLTLRNNDGYAYLLADVASVDHIAEPLIQNEEYLYGVSLTNNFSVKHSITKIEQTGTVDGEKLIMLEDDYDKIRWVVSKTQTSKNVEDFIFEVKFDIQDIEDKPNKYNSNSTFGFEDTIKTCTGTGPYDIETNGGYKFKLDNLDFDGVSGEDISVGQTKWFQAVSNRDMDSLNADTTFIVEPYLANVVNDSDHHDEYGITWKGLRNGGSSHLVIDDDLGWTILGKRGPIYYKLDPNGSFNVNRTFKLSKLTNGNKLSGNVLGTLQSTSAIFTVYEWTDKNDDEIIDDIDDSKQDPKDELKETKKKISDVIKDEGGNGWVNKGWYVDKAGTHISEMYFVDGGKLYYKQANKYLKDSKGNYYKVVYEADMGEDANFTNRYVYKSGAKKLYTRYYYGDNFLTTDLNPDENAETYISSLLIGFGTMDRRFEECARISLAINGEFTCEIPPNMLPKYW